MTEDRHFAGLRLLVVDDDRSIRKFLTVSLTSLGYHVLSEESGSRGMDAFSNFRPDVVILDLGLPDMDGVEVIENIRKQNKVPIIVLSVRDLQEEKIKALNSGADDYLTKPFGIEELHARLKAVLRRTTRAEEEPVFRSGALSVDLARRLVTVGDREIDLSPTEYDILKLLVAQAGKVVTYKAIFEQIWNKDLDEHEGSEHLIRVTVSHLRSKLEPDPAKPSFILTEPAVGYRMRAD